MDRRGPIRERQPLIGPGLLMLVDTLLHRSLFFSKNMYERRVSDEDRLAFAQLIRKDHMASTAGDEFRESWLNHTRFRVETGVAVAHGIRLGTATASAAHRYGILVFPAIDTRPMTARVLRTRGGSTAGAQQAEAEAEQRADSEAEAAAEAAA